MSIKFPPILKEAFEAVYARTIRYLILFGGRGSAKSWSVARILIQLCLAGPVRILCTRETQKSIEESVYQLLKDQIVLMGYERAFVFTKNSIVCTQTGSSFIFAGLRQQDVTKLKSLEGVDICWAEEAQVITDVSWRVLIPTIRKDNSIIIITFNPELDTDPTYVRFIENTPPRSMVIKLNHDDNPFFGNVLEEERAHLEFTDKTAGQMVYRNVWEGECMPAVEGAIFANEIANLHEQNRIRPLDYDSTGLLYGVMDLGWGVMSMVLVQRFASTISIVAYREWTHTTYHEMTLQLKKEFPSVRWGKIFMPHDAAHKDPKYGKSHIDVMTHLGWDVADIEQIGVENYISAGRTMFENLYIADSEFSNCKQLIHCLRRWRRQIPTTTDHPGAPMKDEFSHGSEAYCYTAVVADDLVNDTTKVVDPYKGFSEAGYAA